MVKKLLLSVGLIALGQPVIFLNALTVSNHGAPYTITKENIMFPTLTIMATAFNKQQLLTPETPQIALAGRSNVGKSSLINALASRKQLAKTSSTPGKTRSINYYAIDYVEGFTPKAFLVDLPGYGYARCSQQERLQWAKFLEYYLASTSGLVSLALLLDSRLTPQKLDKNLVSFARSIRLPVIPIFTKADKCRKSDLETNLKAWQQELGNTEFIITSAQKKNGVDTLWEVFTALLCEIPSTPSDD